MRICLTIFALLFTSLLFGESAADFFANGLRYYVRRDYDSAREMFKNSESEEGDIGKQSRFYLASIAAFKGEKNAYDLFSSLLKNPPKDKLNLIAGELAKFASANGEYARLVDDLKPIVDSGKTDTLVDWYYAEALFQSGKIEESKKFWSRILQENFDSISAIGVDMFVDSYILGDKFAKLFDISELLKNTPVAQSRLSMLKGEKVTQPQSEIGLFAQIDLAESGEKIDNKLLAETLYKYRDAPFAWRGALALSTNYFREKKYELAETFARDAELLAPPEMDIQRFCLMALADSLRLQKKYSDAIYYYEKIYMSPRMGGETAAEAIYKAGICYYEQGDWGNAHVCFERVFVLYFKFEYWGSRAYYYDAIALYSLGERRDANATLLEYFKRAKDKKSDIYLKAKEFYDKI